MEEGMRAIAMGALLAAFAVGLLGNVLAADCQGQTKVGKGPNGQTKVVCLDGKYSTCMSDSQSLGWSYAEAKSYCDGRKQLGRVK
jgi:hypothetical protein